MTVTHVVVQGEYLSLIALRYGFHDYRAIWDHPDNAALRQQRKNASVLLPGDVVSIPDRSRGTVSGATGTMNPFLAGSDDAFLNMRFEDASAKPMANRDGTATFGGTNASGSFLKKSVPQSTDGDGHWQVTFTGAFAGRTMATEGDYDLPAQPSAAAATFRLLIGNLDPVDTPTGQRARLNNLGYFAGYAEDDADQLEWATEEFQCDEKLKDRGLFADRARNLATWNHLAKRHGDMLAGEEVS